MRDRSLLQLISFFTFDFPVSYNYIYSCFRRTHERQSTIHASWPAEATRYKLIHEYWNNAIKHYLLLLIMAHFSVMSYNNQLNSLSMVVSVTLGIAAYLPLYFLLYRPIFTGDYLPKLETAIAEYEGRKRTWMEKCKQDQLSNRALVFLFYAIDKASKANYLTPSDKCADLLHKIFGSSPDGIKKALDLVFKKDKRAKLEHRHLVEVGKSFEEAYAILEAMQFEEGIQRLKQLELQFQRS